MDEENQLCKSCDKRFGKLFQCSRCKKASYCSKECQKADWKSHKTSCKSSSSFLPSSTDHRGNRLSGDKILGQMVNDKKHIPEEESEIMTTMMERMSQFLPESKRRQIELDIPKFHMEYKETYPKEKAHFRHLKMAFEQQKRWGFTAMSLGKMDDWNEGMYMKRYGELSPKLFEFLRSNPTLGDIFQPSFLKYPKEKYQTLKNVPVRRNMHDRGKTYVYLGFVDLHALMMGQVRGSNGAVRFVGYEMSEICVARSIVLYEMMTQQMDGESILQVWFSTGWNDKTLKDFKIACQCVLDTVEIVNVAVKELIQLWLGTTLSLRSAKEKWEAASAVGWLFDIAGNLCKKEDRVAFCRYCFTGQIFSVSSQKHGNVSMFCLTKRFRKYGPSSESILTTLSLEFFPYDGHLLQSMENHIKQELRNLKQWIKEGAVYCEFHVAELTPQNKSTLTEIRSLNPYHIDWSNIPDYYSKEDFIKMAHACSTDITTHTAHFMNWSKYVYGTFILEYGERASIIHYQLKKVFEMEYQMLHASGRIPFFFKDKYFVHPYNLSSDVLALANREKFLQYYFDVKGVEINRHDEVIREPQSNFFQRTAQIFNIMFTFNQSLSFTLFRP